MGIKSVGIYLFRCGDIILVFIGVYVLFIVGERGVGIGYLGCLDVRIGFFERFWL